jgi:hypothetical protein
MAIPFPTLVLDMGQVWFYDSNTNAVATANSSPDSAIGYSDYLFYEAELHAGIGLHGPYNSMTALYAANPTAKATNAQAGAGSSLIANGPQPAISAIGGAVSSVDSGINAVGDFFGKLSEGNLWLRIGEFALGIVVIAVALGKLTGLENGVKAVAKVVK